MHQDTMWLHAGDLLSYLHADLPLLDITTITKEERGCLLTFPFQIGISSSFFQIYNIARLFAHGNSRRGKI